MANPSLRRALGWALVATAALVIITNLMEHAGVFQLMTPGWEDLLIGYPTGLLLGLTGLVILGSRPAGH